MTISLIEVVLDLLNTFSSKDGVSDTLSPSTIVEVRSKVDMGQKNIVFGSYVMVHIGKTDTIKIRCIPAISLKRQTVLVGIIL